MPARSGKLFLNASLATAVRELWERGPGERLPLPLDAGRGRHPAMDVEAIAQLLDRLRLNEEGLREREAASHPAIGADVEGGGMVGIGGVVEEGDPLVDAGGDRARVVDPAGALPEAA